MEIFREKRSAELLLKVPFQLINSYHLIIPFPGSRRNFLEGEKLGQIICHASSFVGALTVLHKST